MGDGSWSLYFLATLILMVVSALFSLLETALTNANTLRLMNMAEEGAKNAKTAVKILGEGEKALSTILICNNIVNIAAVSYSTVMFLGWFGAKGALISTAALTCAILIFSEILPKNYARHNSEKILLAFGALLRLIMAVFTPLTIIYMLLQSGVNALFSHEEKGPSVTEEELKSIIETTFDEGVLEEEEADLVQSALDFSDITVQEILTPRVDVVAVEIEDSIDEILKLVIEERYARLPVYEKTIDRIVGILHTRDLLEAVILKKEIKLADMLTQPYYIHKTKKLSTLMAEFQRMRVHIAVVTDDYGGTVGIVTLEDLLEELVGEIYDEDDEVIEDFVEISPGIYQASGEMDVEDMFEKLEFVNRNFETGYYSLSGWVMSLFEHMPEVGETLNYKGIEITVAELDDRRITKLLITYKKPSLKGEI